MNDRYFLTAATTEADGAVLPTEMAYFRLSNEAREFLLAIARQAEILSYSGGLRRLEVDLPAGSAELRFLISDRGNLLKSLRAGAVRQITLKNNETVRALRGAGPGTIEIGRQLSAAAVEAFEAEQVFAESVQAIFTGDGAFALSAEYLFLEGSGQTSALRTESLLDEKKAAFCCK